LDQRACLQNVSTHLPCNWKAGVDAHNEAIHVPWLHRDIAGEIDVGSACVEPAGRHGRIRVPTTGGLTEQLFVFPNLHLNLSRDGAELQVLRHLPDSIPGRCRLDLQVYSAVGTRSSASHRWVEWDDDAFGPVTGADLRTLVDVQLGLASTRFPGLRTGPGEELITRFHAEVTRLVQR
jgi:hypothetical protein